MSFVLGLALFAALPQEVAYEHLKTVPYADRRYTRYLYQPAVAQAVKRGKSQAFWINNLHLQSYPTRPLMIDDKFGILYSIDIREYGWSPSAFATVARREPYFREYPFGCVSIELSKAAHEEINIIRDGHADFIVRADWFFRETFESDRSSSYYDLLYSRFRFKLDEKKLTSFVNFPKDEAEFEKLFAVDKFREHLAEFKIDTRHGAIVEGAEKGVSFVARQNRLIERKITSTGSYYKSFDVKETTGKRDFAETLHKDFEFDAGEILTDLPGGGMAALLVDAKGNIVQVADNRFATDNSDLKYDARVRTPGSCFICHESKYIKPQNLIEEIIAKRLKINFRSKDDEIAARGYFLDWIDKLEYEQTRFEKFLAKTSGLKAGVNAAALKEWRDEYDAPVNLATAARETYLTVEEFKKIGEKSTKRRVHMLVQGMTIPRKTWEVDGYKEVMLQKALVKP